MSVMSSMTCVRRDTTSHTSTGHGWLSSASGDFVTQLTIIKTNHAHQIAHADALVQGLLAAGVSASVSLVSQKIKTKHVACWGWRLGKRLREAGHEVLVMERGYLGDRFSYTSLGWNGLNGYAEFPKHPYDGGTRFESIGGRIAPWRTIGDYVLILGQVPRDASLRGVDLNPFYEIWARQAQEYYGKPVLFRPHPHVVKRGGRGPNLPLCDAPTLKEALDSAFLCLNYNSNSSVDAVLAGAPTVTFDRGSMAWEVCGRSTGEIIRPDREVWAHKLAFTQWTIDEIKSGIPLEKFAARIRRG